MTSVARKSHMATLPGVTGGVMVPGVRAGRVAAESVEVGEAVASAIVIESLGSEPVEA